MIFNIAQLDANQLDAVRALEGQTGKTIIALQGIEASMATLTNEELRTLRGVEERLGLTLVAVD
ncbi:MAG: hypothetical protein VX733_00270 [Candidatus Latescibacterota bacterium]|nr:hypothetical protein [Candidatus Latescibacterota bacterium]